MRMLLAAFVSLLVINLNGQTSFRKNLNVGDSLPEISFSNVINHPSGELRFSEFDGKAIILDFWAPWCSPCVAMFPKLDSIQNKFKDQLQVIPVTRSDAEYSEKILKILERNKGINLTLSIVNDSILSKAFVHRILPHYVWIDSKGKVRAITGSDELTEKNVNSLINGIDFKYTRKTEPLYIEYDKAVFGHQVPLKTDELEYQSVITKYQPGLSSQLQWGYESDHILFANVPIIQLYQLAYGWRDFLAYFDFNRVALVNFTSTDSLQIGRFTDKNHKLWQKQLFFEHSYNYELIVPNSKVKFTNEEMFEMMQQDLNRYFGKVLGIQGKAEKRKVKCIALIKTGTDNQLRSVEPGNRKDLVNENYLRINGLPMSAFIAKFQGFINTSWGMPIVDETGYNGLVNIELDCQLADLKKLNEQLKKYGLKFAERVREMDIIVLTKR